MFFRKRHARRQLELLGQHVHEIGELERMRDDYQRDGFRGMVLATNYEIISHASRALSILRQFEESFRGETPGADMREYLAAKVTLPSLRRDEVETASTHLVEQLYTEFIRSDRGKTQNQQHYESGER